MPRPTGSAATAAALGVLATAVVTVVVVVVQPWCPVAGGRRSEGEDSPYGVAADPWTRNPRRRLFRRTSRPCRRHHLAAQAPLPVAYDRSSAARWGRHRAGPAPKRGGPACAVLLPPRPTGRTRRWCEYLRPASTRGVGCGARIMRLHAYLTHYLRRHRAEARTYRLRGPSVHADALLDALHALHGRCAYPRKAAIVADFVRDSLRERWRATTERFTTTSSAPPSTAAPPGGATHNMHRAQPFMWLLVAAGVPRSTTSGGRPFHWTRK